MADNSSRSAFARRLTELCDDMKMPARGRQRLLAGAFKVSQQAAGKWLRGESYPETEMLLAIATWADVNINWLLQGSGPKRGNRIDAKILVLDEALHSMPLEMGTDVLDNIRAKLIRFGKIEAREPSPRYLAMLEAYERDLGGSKKPH